MCTIILYIKKLDFCQKKYNSQKQWTDPCINNWNWYTNPARIIQKICKRISHCSLITTQWNNIFTILLYWVGGCLTTNVASALLDKLPCHKRNQTANHHFQTPDRTRRGRGIGRGSRGMGRGSRDFPESLCRRKDPPARALSGDHGDVELLAILALRPDGGVIVMLAGLCEVQNDGSKWIQFNGIFQRAIVVIFSWDLHHVVQPREWENCRFFGLVSNIIEVMP